MPKISVDTNILINDSSILFDTTKEFVISFQVLRELDKLKRNPDLKRSAQVAIKNIKAQLLANKLEILNVPTKDSLGDSPDELILLDTLNTGASFLSEDINATVIATSLGIHLSDVDAEADIDYGYKGYKEIAINDEYSKTLRTLKEIPKEEFELTMNVELGVNEYCVVQDGTEFPDIWKTVVEDTNGEETSKVVRISQKMSPYTNAGVKGVQPLDPIQMCVLDAVFDPLCPLVVVDGVLGTGKTMLSMMAALATTQGENRYQYYDQIFVTASPESVNTRLYTGFKPGTSEDKLSGHLSGFKSNLKFLLDPKRIKENRKKKNPDEEDETPSEAAWRNNFSIVEIDEMQGMSLHNSILLVDEAQKLSDDSLKLILSRIAEGSKVVLMGDTVGQVYGLNRGHEGFKVLFRHLGRSPEMCYIKLENIYRSELAKFVAKIFND
jgi:PhoH-like ATPase